MTLIYSIPTQKFFKGSLITSPDQVVVSQEEYKTGPENFIIVKNITSCKITLDSTRSEHITIKAVTRVLIMPDINQIDEEYDEILLEKGASIELYFCFGYWYIMSSDGLKLS